jgi:hypothetical protein
MITVQLNGRLGNQMFQYAAAAALADRWQTQVRFDLSLLDMSGGRYELSCFGIAPVAASREDLPLRQRVGYSASLKKGKSAAERLLPFVRKTVLLESVPFEFQKDFFDYAPRCYLSGYFQNELYFKRIESKIRGEFKIRLELSEQTKELLAKIKNSLAISVHVRRGDYIINSEYNWFFGCCEAEYYTKACEAAQCLGKSLLWIFFSDDVKWVRSVLLPTLLERKLIANYEVVDWTGDELSFEDIHLMSSAQHHVISNSTFSWWGAWLNPQASKKVFAPSHWLQNAQADSIVPPEWIRVSNRGSPHDLR